LPFTKVEETKDPRKPNVTITHSKCVKSCNEFKDYVEIANRCFKIESNSTDPEADVTSFFSNVVEDFSLTWPSILITCGVALVFSYVVLMLFRYAIKYVIWVIYISLVLLLAILAIVMLALFIAANNSKDPREKEAATGLLIAAGVFGLFAIVFALVLYFFRKRIRLVVQLFKEASKVLIDVPMIIFEPLLTFISMGVACVGFLYFALIILSSGDLKVQNDAAGKFDKASYEPGPVASIAHFVNFVAFIWFTSFILGCQHFVIASTVCQWFFTRSKDKLDSPISRAFSHLLNFHIGSVCLGSLLITLMKIIRMIIEYAKSSLNESQNPAARFASCCCDWIMQMLEEFIQYLIRNAYIIVALNGTPLIESGKKAFTLITNNLLDVVALNKFGDFVLVVGRLFVIAISGFICYELVSVSPNHDHFFIGFQFIFSHREPHMSTTRSFQSSSVSFSPG
jgi:solute carrier family 44 (choline transporter-like protein), member 1